jgi:hypothetical protein
LQTREYKYVARFESSTMDEWSVAVWNKIGPDGKQGGWFSKPCKTFILKSGSIQYVAFDEDSQGGWAAAPGPFIPTDKQSAFASTWGEFDFGSVINTGWSGFDVSAIVAQNAGLDVQGMRICDELAHTCSSITAMLQPSTTLTREKISTKVVLVVTLRLVRLGST